MSMDNLIAPKSSRRKLYDFNNNVKTFFEEKELKADIDKQDKEFEEEYRKEKINNSIQESYNARLYDKRKENIKKDAIINETILSCIPNLFSSIVYRSLPLDEDFKIHNLKYIHENATSYFNILVEKGIIDLANLEESSFKDMVEDIAVALTDGSEDNDGDNIELNTVMSNCFKCNPYNQQIIDAIRGKVETAVKIEKDKAFDKCCQLEESVIQPRKTIFRFLQESNVRNVVNESTELNKKMSKDDVMDISLAETILDYTMLEAAHTCKLIKIDTYKLNKIKL